MSTTFPEKAPVDPSTAKYHGTPPAFHNGAIVVSALGVLGLLLPPRRVDLRTALLSTATFFGTNQLVYDYTGRSISQRFGQRADKMTESLNGLPEPARRAQAAMRAERERRAAASGEPVRDKRPEWKREWDEAERRALDAGRGYGDLIMDTIKEVIGMKEKDSSAADEPQSKTPAETRSQSGPPLDDRDPKK